MPSSRRPFRRARRAFAFIGSLAASALAPKERRQAQRPFTLIELLVVIAIIAILASLLLPSLKQAQAKAKATACASNQKQVAIYHLLYADENDTWFPMAHGTSAAVLYVDTKKTEDFDSYYPQLDIFHCPATEYLHSIEKYGPNGRIYRGVNSTYRIYASRGNKDAARSYIYWGFYALGGKPTTPDSPYHVACPSTKMAGRLLKDRDDDQRMYIDDPAGQPMLMDGRSENKGVWQIYASYADCIDNHPNLDGINVTFLDGHCQWARQVEGVPRRMFVGYWKGYMRW